MKKQGIKAQFSKAATQYESYADIQAKVFEQLLPLIKKSNPASILDIGCGTGRHTQQLAQRFENATILGIDFSDEMISVATQTNSSSQTTYQVADVDHYYPKNTFDLIVSNATLQWMPDLYATLAHLKSMLAPNGCIAFTYFGPETYIELQKLLPHLCLPAQRFLAKPKIQMILSQHFQNAQLIEKKITITFPNLHTLLKTIKHTGTKGAHQPQPSIWTPTYLKNLEQRYIKQFHKIQVTYQIFWCIIKSK